MKSYFKQRLELSFTNEFSEIFLFKISMPLDPVLNLEGYYINIVDKIRRWLSQEQRVAFKDILAKIDRIPNKDTDRIILTMDSGIILDMPPKMTERDYEILFAQINVLLMRFDDSLKMVAQTRTSVS